MRPIHILRLRDANRIGGPEKTILDTATSIDHNRFNFTLASFVDTKNPSNEFLEKAKELNIPTFPLRMGGRGDFRAVLRLRDYLKKNRVDIFHAHDYKARLVGYWAARLARIPAVTTLHGWIQNTKRATLYLAFDRLMLRFYLKVIVVSRDLEKKVFDLGVPSERILLLHNAIAAPQGQQLSAEYYRHKLGFNDHMSLIGSIGRLSKEKGLDDLLLAAHSVLKKFPTARFLIIGEGPEKVYLKAKAAEMGVGPFLTFLGFRTDMEMIYPALDVVALSSYTEGLPKVLLEAMSYGKPVVATGVGGVPEVIIANKTGILVPAKSPDLLAKGICDILAEPDMARELGDAGRNLIQSQFSLGTRTLRLENLYEQISQTRRGLSKG